MRFNSIHRLLKSNQSNKTYQTPQHQILDPSLVLVSLLLVFLRPKKFWVRLCNLYSFIIFFIERINQFCSAIRYYFVYSSRNIHLHTSGKRHACSLCLRYRSSLNVRAGLVHVELEVTKIQVVVEWHAEFVQLHWTSIFDCCNIHRQQISVLNRDKCTLFFRNW